MLILIKFYNLRWILSKGKKRIFAYENRPLCVYKFHESLYETLESVTIILEISSSVCVTSVWKKEKKEWNKNLKNRKNRIKKEWETHQEDDWRYHTLVSYDPQSSSWWVSYERILVIIGNFCNSCILVILENVRLINVETKLYTLVSTFMSRTFSKIPLICPVFLACWFVKTLSLHSTWMSTYPGRWESY